jgi:hypothetical protein
MSIKTAYVNYQLPKETASMLTSTIKQRFIYVYLRMYFMLVPLMQDLKIE